MCRVVPSQDNRYKKERKVEVVPIHKCCGLVPFSIPQRILRSFSFLFFFSPFFFFSLLYPSPRSLRLQYQIKTQISIRLCITLHLFQNTKILSNSYNVYIIFYNFSLLVFSTLRLYYDSSYLVLCH